MVTALFQSAVIELKTKCYHVPFYFSNVVSFDSDFVEENAQALPLIAKKVSQSCKSLKCSGFVMKQLLQNVIIANIATVYSDLHVTLISLF